MKLRRKCTTTKEVQKVLRCFLKKITPPGKKFRDRWSWRLRQISNLMMSSVKFIETLADAHASFNLNNFYVFWRTRNGKWFEQDKANNADSALIISYLGVNWIQQDHLRMNNSTRSNNHLWSIDLFRSMIISNNRSKVRDDPFTTRPPGPPPPWLIVSSSLEVDSDQSEACLVHSARWSDG